VDKSVSLLAGESRSGGCAWGTACRLVAIFLAGTVSACGLGVAEAAAQTRVDMRVDMELVIAVDVSLTPIGAALQFARTLLAESGFAGMRRVVDISGDGPNNLGPSAPTARDRLVAEGVVVNGLLIMLKTSSPTFFDLTNLDRDYAACVIGGAGSFMVPVKDVAELKSAIRRKLLLDQRTGVGPLAPEGGAKSEARWREV
jgi:uncharacterized protein DUF1194